MDFENNSILNNISLFYKKNKIKKKSCEKKLDKNKILDYSIIKSPKKNLLKKNFSQKKKKKFLGKKKNIFKIKKSNNFSIIKNK